VPAPGGRVVGHVRAREPAERAADARLAERVDAEAARQRIGDLGHVAARPAAAEVAPHHVPRVGGHGQGHGREGANGARDGAEAAAQGGAEGVVLRPARQ
jgi:hypothetical protein